MSKRMDETSECDEYDAQYGRRVAVKVTGYCPRGQKMWGVKE